MSLQTTPEIEATLRREAAARGVSVDNLLREALHLYRKQYGFPAVRQSDDFPDSAREMVWVASPDLQFVNQWVALSGDQVIAHGPQGKSFTNPRAPKALIRLLCSL